MSNLVPYQNQELTEIVDDALAVMPVSYQDNEMLQAITHLAECYLVSREQAHLDDIQSLIDAAKADDIAVVFQMRDAVLDEIEELRQETREGFAAVGQAMHQIDERLARIERLKCPKPVMKLTPVKTTTPGVESCVLLASIAIVALMLVQQTLNVRLSFWESQYQHQQLQNGR
ncbi:MAG: hypothetical protein F6K09_00950 [Merismopedia sp. SIO2A8]|nr:hypothetical protein [Symploca sp. SIO2B6]NET47299.1 hypothetical protein [Merismopedia sp. SIO2A8]